MVYNRNTIRGCTSVLIGIPNIEEQGKAMLRVIRRDYVINHLSKPKIVWLEGWEEQVLFSDRLDKGF